MKNTVQIVTILVFIIILFSSCEKSKEDLNTIQHFHQINIDDMKHGFIRDTSYAEAVRQWEIGRDNSTELDYDIEDIINPYLLTLVCSAVLFYQIGKNSRK